MCINTCSQEILGGREGETEEREQSRTRGWIGGWCGWWFSRRGTEEREKARDLKALIPAGQENSKSQDARASLTRNRACLRDEPLWCREPTGGASWWSTSSAARSWNGVRPPHCPLRIAGETDVHGSVLLFSRWTGPCQDLCLRIYGHRARTKLGKPRALSSIVRHRSRKKRLGVRFYFTHTVSSRSNWKIYLKTAYKNISISMSSCICKCRK